MDEELDDNSDEFSICSSSSNEGTGAESTNLVSPSISAPSLQELDNSTPSLQRDDLHFLQYAKRDPFLLLHKFCYFLGMGANAAYFPFAIQLWTSPLFGLTVAESGVIFAVGHVISMIVSPLVMRIADQNKSWRKGVLVSGILLQILFLGLLYRSSGFWQILLFEGLQEAASCAVWPSFDAATLRVLEVAHGNSHFYGNTRAFGALGWGAFAWLFGAIYDSHGLGMWWWCFATAMLPVALLALFIPVESRSAQSVKMDVLVKSLVRWDVFILLFIVFLTAVLLQIVDVYRFPFLATLPNCTNQILGISITVTALSEAPFFFITSWILQRLDVGPALCVVLAGYGVRYIYYSLINNPWYTMPAELMHGVTFALGWSAATQYVSSLLPPELSTSAQGLLAGIQWGLGAACGSLLGGFMQGLFGWRIMWRIGSGVAFAGLFLMVVELRRTKKKGGEGEGGEGASPTSTSGS